MDAWMLRLALCAALAAATTGCFAYLRTNYEQPIPTDEAIAAIVPGVSTSS